MLFICYLWFFTCYFCKYYLGTDHIQLPDTDKHWIRVNLLISDSPFADHSTWLADIIRNGDNNKQQQRRKHRGRRAGVKQNLRTRAHRPPLPSVLLAIVQSLDNKMDDLRGRLKYQRDVRNCNILCFTETWLTPSIRYNAIQPEESLSVHHKDRMDESGKKKGGGICFMVNSNWCDTRNITTLTHFCSPNLEFLTIKCWPHFLPREFSSVIITAVYIPPQASTETALSELYKTLNSY